MLAGLVCVLPARAPAVAGGLVVVNGDGYTPGDHKPVRGVARAPLVIVEGTQLQFLNRDGNTHTLTSMDVGADGRPLFDSGAPPSNALTPVAGTDALPPGEYGFKCLIHYNAGNPAISMQGSLTVIGPP